MSGAEYSGQVEEGLALVLVLVEAWLAAILYVLGHDVPKIFPCPLTRVKQHPIDMTRIGDIINGNHSLKAVYALRHRICLIYNTHVIFTCNPSAIFPLSKPELRPLPCTAAATFVYWYTVDLHDMEVLVVAANLACHFCVDLAGLRGLSEWRRNPDLSLKGNGPLNSDIDGICFVLFCIFL